MEVDPRLQISDLTDFPYSALQYNEYGNPINIRTGYVESLRDDRARMNQTRAMHIPTRSPYVDDQPNRYGQHAFYERSPISHSPNGFSPTRKSPQHAPEPSLETEQSGSVKDPTNFVAPHRSAPLQANPPNLTRWRERFFNIEEPLLLTQEEYATYFPHVDNVYSHRSTQKYKRKPFVSHYWDCRLKGRPTGTPMNKKKGDEDENPAKKKRKRKVRERDLCDVKIKVTEYFGRDELEALRKLGLGTESNESSLTYTHNKQSGDISFGILEPSQEYPEGHPGSNGRKWYMIQRVNGDKDDEILDLNHKHTLEESDRIKKNSVQRWLVAQEKEKKKAGNHSTSDEFDTSTDISTPPSRFHASGTALQTLYSHATDTSNHLTFYGSSFCPFAQRVWIALEHIGIPYRLYETTERDYYKDPNDSPDGPLKAHIDDLGDLHPQGRLPCLKHNNFIVWESEVMMQYLEDLAMGQSLFHTAVGNPQLKAHSRMWVDYINRRILPVFYAVLLVPGSAAGQLGAGPDCEASISHAQANAHAEDDMSHRVQSERYPLRDGHQRNRPSQPTTLPFGMVDDSTISTSAKLLATLNANITTLVNASHQTGPYFLGDTLSYVDICFAPWIVRMSRVLAVYRGFSSPEIGTRWQAWCDAIENDQVVRRTVSEDKSYHDVYGGAKYHVDEEGGFTTDWEYDERGRVKYDVAREKRNNFAEMDPAMRMVDAEAFDWGGEGWSKFG